MRSGFKANNPMSDIGPDTVKPPREKWLFEEMFFEIAAAGARTYQRRFALERLGKIRRMVESLVSDPVRRKELLADVDYVIGQVGAIK